MSFTVVNNDISNQYRTDIVAKSLSSATANLITSARSGEVVIIGDSCVTYSKLLNLGLEIYQVVEPDRFVIGANNIKMKRHSTGLWSILRQKGDQVELLGYHNLDVDDSLAEEKWDDFAKTFVKVFNLEFGDVLPLKSTAGGFIGFKSKELVPPVFGEYEKDGELYYDQSVGVWGAKNPTLGANMFTTGRAVFVTEETKDVISDIIGPFELNLPHSSFIGAMLLLSNKVPGGTNSSDLQSLADTLLSDIADLPIEMASAIAEEIDNAVPPVPEWVSGSVEGPIFGVNVKQLLETEVNKITRGITEEFDTLSGKIESFNNLLSQDLDFSSLQYEMASALKAQVSPLLNEAGNARKELNDLRSQIASLSNVDEMSDEVLDHVKSTLTAGLSSAFKAFERSSLDVTKALYDALSLDLPSFVYKPVSIIGPDEIHSEIKRVALSIQESLSRAYTSETLSYDKTMYNLTNADRNALQSNEIGRSLANNSLANASFVNNKAFSDMNFDLDDFSTEFTVPGISLPSIEFPDVENLSFESPFDILANLGGFLDEDLSVAIDTGIAAYGAVSGSLAAIATIGINIPIAGWIVGAAAGIAAGIASLFESSASKRRRARRTALVNSVNSSLDSIKRNQVAAQEINESIGRLLQSVNEFSGNYMKELIQLNSDTLGDHVTTLSNEIVGLADKPGYFWDNLENKRSTNVNALLNYGFSSSSEDLFFKESHVSLDDSYFNTRCSKLGFESFAGALASSLWSSGSLLIPEPLLVRDAMQKDELLSSFVPTVFEDFTDELIARCVTALRPLGIVFDIEDELKAFVISCSAKTKIYNQLVISDELHRLVINCKDRTITDEEVTATPEAKVLLGVPSFTPAEPDFQTVFSDYALGTQFSLESNGPVLTSFKFGDSAYSSMDWVIPMGLIYERMRSLFNDYVKSKGIVDVRDHGESFTFVNNSGQVLSPSAAASQLNFTLMRVSDNDGHFFPVYVATNAFYTFGHNVGDDYDNLFTNKLCFIFSPCRKYDQVCQSFNLSSIYNSGFSMPDQWEYYNSYKDVGIRYLDYKYYADVSMIANYMTWTQTHLNEVRAKFTWSPWHSGQALTYNTWRQEHGTPSGGPMPYMP